MADDKDFLLKILNNATGNGNNENNSKFGGPLQPAGVFSPVKIICLSVILVLTLLGNSIVIIILSRKRSSSASLMSFFILNLCVADILVGIFQILPDILDEVLVTHRGCDFTCRLKKYMAMFVSYLSTYVMIATVFDRYQAICNPLKRNMAGEYRKYGILGIAYGISGFLAVPQLILYGMVDHPGTESSDCLVIYQIMKIPQVAYFALTGFILPLFLLMFLNGRMSYVVWKVYKARMPSVSSSVQGKTDKQSGQLTSNLKKSDTVVTDTESEGKTVVVKMPSNGTMRYSSTGGLSRAKTRTFQLMLIVVVAFVLCWSPFFVAHVYWATQDYSPDINPVAVTFLVLSSLNSCCNPFIYLFFNWKALQISPCATRMGIGSKESSSKTTSKSSELTKKPVSDGTQSTSISQDRRSGEHQCPPVNV